MKRKDFISSAGALMAGVFLPVNKINADDINAGIKIPPYLKRGDTIGIIPPAGYTTHQEIASAVQVMENWGYKIVTGNTIGKREFTFAGTDDERRGDLQKMLDDPKIKAIMCARGGYGSLRIVDKLDRTKFKQNPKWVIGFSDITVSHNHIHTNCKMASIHSKMTNSFPDDWTKAEPIQIETIISIRDAIEGRPMKYTAPSHPLNKQGKATGILIGGNLKTIENLAGSASDINTTGKIMFVEDTGEYLYSMDRMFWNLKRTGKLKNLKALIVGGFKVKPDDEGSEFGRTVQDIVLEKVKEFKYPVCFDFPVGHQRNNFALKCGITHNLNVTSEGTILTETL